MSARSPDGDGGGGGGQVAYLLELHTNAAGYCAQLRMLVAGEAPATHSRAIAGRGSAATAPAAILAAVIDAYIPAAGGDGARQRRTRSRPRP